MGEAPKGERALLMGAASKLMSKNSYSATIVNIADSKRRPTLHLMPDKPAEVIVLPVVRPFLVHDPLIEIPKAPDDPSAA